MNHPNESKTLFSDNEIAKYSLPFGDIQLDSEVGKGALNIPPAEILNPIPENESDGLYKIWGGITMQELESK